MNQKQLALEACDIAQKDRLTKAASAYIEAFLTAEGEPNAAALRKEAGDRFMAGLKVLNAARDGSRAVVEQALP
jgi:hypothetical protein